MKSHVHRSRIWNHPFPLWYYPTKFLWLNWVLLFCFNRTNFFPFLDSKTTIFSFQKEIITTSLFRKLTKVSECKLNSMSLFMPFTETDNFCYTFYIWTEKQHIELWFTAHRSTDFFFFLKKEIIVIYLVTCKNCQCHYVGQTRQQVSWRMNSYRYDICNFEDPTFSSSIATHSNSSDHSLNDFSFMPIDIV